MRLDAQLLNSAPVYLNPLREREIDLRGHKIPAIENLGVLNDGVDTLDLTDNALTSLANFPLMPRVTCLLVSHNPLRTLPRALPAALPNLTTLILSDTAFAAESLGEIGVTLRRARYLHTASFRGSPVAEVVNYRLWLVYNCRRLRFLDFERVTAAERSRARELFETADGEPSASAIALLSAETKSDNTFNPGESATENGKLGKTLTKEQKESIRRAIETAETVEEMRRLQRMLAQGFIPTEKDLKELSKK